MAEYYGEYTHNTEILSNGYKVTRNLNPELIECQFWRPVEIGDLLYGDEIATEENGINRIGFNCRYIGEEVPTISYLTEEFKVYQQQVLKNAQIMAATFIKRKIKIVSGGTENHLMLVDLIGKEFTGKDADAALGEAFITVNKNAVPNDPRSPFVTSGLRIGTPAITTRGFKEAESEDLAHWICDVLDSLESGTSNTVIPEVREKVLELCSRFPVYS